MPLEWGDPEHSLERTQFFDVLQACLDHLPASLARIFMMREWLEIETPEICKELGLPMLHFEPGRSLVARAGVSVYRINAVKRTFSRRWLLLDGGMADNPRPALYGARYSALPVLQPGRLISGNAWLGGPYCESGDILIHDLPMAEVQPGELVAIPVSGAYQLSMGSNYNGARRPAVLWLSAGEARMIQRRETLDELVDRDFPL